MASAPKPPANAVDPRRVSEVVKAVLDRQPPLTAAQQAVVDRYIARMNGL